MVEILNTNALKKEIRRIVKEELIKEVPKNQVDSLWKYLNKLNERIKILE